MKNPFSVLVSKFKHLRIKESASFIAIVHFDSEKRLRSRFPILKFVPAWAVSFLKKYFLPVCRGQIMGRVSGIIFAIPETSKNILKNKQPYLKQLQSLINIANRSGVSYVSVDSVLALSMPDIHVPAKMQLFTGSFYTGVTMAESVIKIAGNIKSKNITITGAGLDCAIVAAVFLSKSGANRFVLVDTTDRKDKVHVLSNFLKQLGVDAKIVSNADKKSLKDSDILLNFPLENQFDFLSHTYINKKAIIFCTEFACESTNLQKESVKLYRGDLVKLPKIYTDFYDFDDSSVVPAHVAEGLLLMLHPNNNINFKSNTDIMSLITNAHTIQSYAKKSRFYTHPLPQKL